MEDPQHELGFELGLRAPKHIGESLPVHSGTDGKVLRLAKGEVAIKHGDLEGGGGESETQRNFQPPCARPAYQHLHVITKQLTRFAQPPKRHGRVDVRGSIGRWHRNY